MQDIFRRVPGRLLQHSMQVLYVLGGAVTIAYLMMAFGIRDQQGNLARVKASAEQAETVQTINLGLIRKAIADDSNAAFASDEKILGGLDRLEQAHAAPGANRNKSLDTLLKDYTAAAKKLQKIPAQQLSSHHPELSQLLDSLSPRLLQEMRSVGSLHLRQSESMLGDTANKQHWMFAVSLGSLVMIGVLLLQPLLKQLQESALRMRQEKILADKVIDTAQVHIFGLDADGNVVLANRHAELHSGWGGDEIKGCGFFERFIPADRRHELQTLFNGMMSGAIGTRAQIEAPMLVSSGKKMPMVWEMTVIEEPASGKPAMFLITASEAFERKPAGERPAAKVLQFNARMSEEVLAAGDDPLNRGIGNSEAGNIIRMPESLYCRSESPVAQAAKDTIAFFTEDGYSGFPGHFDQDRICRILPRHNEFCNKLGWNRLLNQHNESLDDDLYALMPGKSEYRHFELKHTDHDTSVAESVYAWLREKDNLSNDILDALLAVLDEMIENSLYSAPRDSSGMPYYAKGEARELSTFEEISVDVARGGDILGLMITDYWGTLTPGIFFKSLAQAMEEGIEARENGAGLYMIWLLSDYLQIRVHPQKCTQVTVLWDLNGGFIDRNVDAGLQFLYHNDYEAPYQMRAKI
ncbi:PAS domain-containing protein [Methylomicrobium sp. Wu6]|uniref:PAS domain-containing protein n=1 Tax=Methylomicrobium sp. Wu6 TaxID=3107928 RepID=UPI002DD672B9|nr:PAS domain-containing protein [Methylomicrobium sp. Wu6]MEC4750078.1 PAS domain-containing protein [Methylomicrobium sp. Wu6]